MQKNILCVSSVLDASGVWRERKGEGKGTEGKQGVGQGIKECGE